MSACKAYHACSCIWKLAETCCVVTKLSDFLARHIFLLQNTHTHTDLAAITRPKSKAATYRFTCGSSTAVLAKLGRKTRKSAKQDCKMAPLSGSCLGQTGLRSLQGSQKSGTFLRCSLLRQQKQCARSSPLQARSGNFRRTRALRRRRADLTLLQPFLCCRKRSELAVRPLCALATPQRSTRSQDKASKKTAVANSCSTQPHASNNNTPWVCF